MVGMETLWSHYELPSVLENDKDVVQGVEVGTGESLKLKTVGVTK